MKIGKIILVAILLYVAYDLISPSVYDYLLVRHGTCTKAVLTSSTIHVKYHKADFVYEFTIDGKAYRGNSLETDTAKVGDSVEIAYLKSMPSANRPIKYFDNFNSKNCRGK